MARADRLPCGTPLDDVLVQVAEGSPPPDRRHQRSCAHCRAALAEIAELWAPIDELGAEVVEAPPGIVSDVMTRVRSLPRTAWYAVVRGDRGVTMTAARVVALVVRTAAQQVPGVTLALGSGRAGPGTEVGLAGSHVVIDVRVVVRYGSHIPTLAGHLRARIREHLVALVGLDPVEVNVDVVDVG